jgi:mono/diheme cytochrome c family protein
MNPDNPLPQLTEEAEPTAGIAATPVWLFLLLLVLTYWGMYYLDKHGGGFQTLVYEPYSDLKYVQSLQPKSEEGELLARGKRNFELYCQICHQASGLGTPGQFPPLAGSEWVNAPGPNRIIHIVLNGLQEPIEVHGQQFNAAMVPWKDIMLKDEDVAAVLTYIRQNKDWGNNASAVKPEQVKPIREKLKDRSAPMTPTELKTIPDSE